MKNPWVIVGVITIVLFGGAIWYSNFSSERSNEGVEELTHIKGNSEATVKLVEYSDFQCPACAAFQPVLKELFDSYGDQLSLEFKHFPLHSSQAAVAAEAAGQQGKFFEFHDILFERQEEWVPAVAQNAFFIKYAEEIGLDVEMFRRHMKSSILQNKVRSEFSEGRSREVTGTPTFFLNGVKMNSDEFKTYAGFIERVVYAIDPSLATSTEESAVSDTRSGVRFGI